MNIDLKSIVQISPKGSKSGFGTGFIIYREKENAYVVTCKHVVDKFGGIDNILVNREQKTCRILSMTDNSVDLVIFLVKDLEGPPLSLNPEYSERQDCDAYGIQPGVGLEYMVSSISLKIGKPVLVRKEPNNSHELANLIPQEKGAAPPGYSGGPVVNNETECVCGVISFGSDFESWFIPISLLREIWLEIPGELFNPKNCSSFSGEYENDVLIAYYEIVPKFRATLIERIKTHLGHNLGEIKIDELDLNNSGNRIATLKSFQNSRILIPIWSPSYFRDHGLLEYSMLQRELILGYKASLPSGLVYPVLAFDLANKNNDLNEPYNRITTMLVAYDYYVDNDLLPSQYQDFNEKIKKWCENNVMNSILSNQRYVKNEELKIPENIPSMKRNKKPVPPWMG